MPMIKTAGDLAYLIGRRAVPRRSILVKDAGDAKPVYHLAGRLYLSRSGWLMLSIPNALARGAFDALSEPGVELPLNRDGQFNAHCSVMRPEEVEQLGGGDAITERGHMLRYSLGPVKTVDPKTWEGVSRVWYLTIISPELRQLRKSYGLSPQPNDDWDFHATFAVRKTGILHANEKSKAAEDKTAEDKTVTPIRQEKRVTESTVDYCPHCNDEIREKSIYVDPERYVYHRPCRDKGPINRFKEPSGQSILDLLPQHEHKEAAHALLPQLQQIKALSDQRNYGAKHQQLLALMKQKPEEWEVDQPQKHHPGVVHKPTHFRFHTDRRTIPPSVKKLAAMLQELSHVSGQ